MRIAPAPPPTANTLPRDDGYARHEPETTLLYRVVREHLGDFLGLASERSRHPLPRYVVNEFNEYMRCGILEHGFGRARCPLCGLDLFVAMSCKK